ncbi:hypothetical protein FE236_00530 [Mariprofundus erugo]|uniref:hypothetical protein n=1 Tax=Mariprofundus erugo TaxID=2528639 RepID=UPI001287B4B7|nr:hypothetical protein [Mariprofundus erugo]TLS78280.1 hypothetical protein FE236_00530 [Mariprofundus erugo]
MKSITIGNKGRDIVSTNYFGTEMARNGLAFVSVNAGAFRLLLPQALESAVREMKTGQYAVISRGSMPELGQHDGIEIMFEDHSDEPFALHMSPGQWDMMMGNAHNNRETTLDVWTESGCQLSMPCYFRMVKKVPHLKPFPIEKAKKSPSSHPAPSDENARSDATLTKPLDILRDKILRSLGANVFVHYPAKLPDELNYWYFYASDCGHSIVAILKEHEHLAFKSDGEAEDYLCPMPAKSVIGYYCVRDGFIIVDNPNLAYHELWGLDAPEDDYEYDD